MAFTKQEVYEYLAAYPQDTIPGVLRQLGYGEEASEYPDDVVEKAENIYKAMGVARSIQKQLAPDTEQQDTAITIRQTSAIAAELLQSQGISFPPDVVMVLAQAVLEEGTQLAKDLTDLKEAALLTGLKSGDRRLVEKLIRSTREETAIIREIFSEETMQTMLDAAIPRIEQPDIKGFLSQLDAKRQKRMQLDAAKEEQRKALPPQQDPKQFVAAFLAARK